MISLPNYCISDTNKEIYLHIALLGLCVRMCVCVYIMYACMYVCMYAHMYVVCMYRHVNDFDKLITYQGAKALGSIQRTQYG